MRLVLIITILLLAGSAQANTLSVCPNGCDYINIQKAVNAANPGDELDIGSGTYTEAVHVDKDLSIYGATAYKFIWLAAVNHFPKSIMATMFKPTYIDGNLGGSNYLGTLLTIGSGANVIIDGITIQNGRGTQQGSSTMGGGIYNKGHLTLLQNCGIHNNVATSGGGIYNEGGVLDVDGCAIYENKADGGYGGGIYNSGGTVTTSTGFTRYRLAQIENNQASYGGGIANNGGTLNVNRCSIYSNSAIGNGGGIWNKGTTNVNPATVDGCTISKNKNAQWGGGIYNDAGSMKITSSYLDGNWALYGGGGIANDGNGVLSVTGSKISGNEAKGINNLGSGGGIDNYDGTVTVKDGEISYNQATTGYGGGLSSEVTGQVTFDGTLKIYQNNAHLPSTIGSDTPWYTSYGVYMGLGTPTIQNGFVPDNQVTNNNHI